MLLISNKLRLKTSFESTLGVDFLYTCKALTVLFGGRKKRHEKAPSIATGFFHAFFIDLFNIALMLSTHSSLSNGSLFAVYRANSIRL